MGCHAITPHLVSLAKKLEGRPFHLVATHCQNNTKENVVAYLKSKGLSDSSPNFTLTSFGGHPKVKGNGHVPYYMVFDHRGRLVREHMCGDYHGGDGLGMIEWVEKMLLEAPEIYLGEEPYAELKSLAEDIKSGKKLSKHLKALDAARESEDPSVAEEAERLTKRLTSWRDARLSTTTDRLATTPSTVLPSLKALAKELKGSSFAEPVEEKLKELQGSPDLKLGIRIEKTIAKGEKQLSAIKACKTCRRKGSRKLSLSCPRCRGENLNILLKIELKVKILLQQNEALPIAAHAKEFIKSLRKS